jgi:hypothetical protein
MELRLTRDEFVRLVASAPGTDDLATERGGLIVVEGGTTAEPLVVPSLLPAVVALAVEAGEPCGTDAPDLWLPPGDLDAVRDTVGRCPQAATALAVLLRGAEGRAVPDGLQLESAVYGVLQAGAEFASWRQDHPARRAGPPPGEPLKLTRDGDTLEVVLSRPHVRNALDATLRDALTNALEVALADPTLQVELRGEGESFCSGGYLDEFGTRPDPASAHLVRVSRSLGWMLHQLAARTCVHVHGPCRGSGVELPAFAGRVVAHPETTFALPEVGLGLIPGAGGTVSLPRRIGRARTAWLALTGAVIDAPTALAWGLVEVIEPGSG